MKKIIFLALSTFLMGGIIPAFGGDKIKEFTYTDLVIGFTDSFQLMWWDKKSGGKYNGAYYRPIIPKDMSGFYPVGDLGENNHNDVNGRRVMAIVKDAKGPKGSALRPPTKFEKVWTDRRSGANMSGSMWRPIPPDGYVALGLVCNKGYGSPSPDVVRCVRKDLVVPAFPGNLIWDDTKTGSARDFGSWRIAAPIALAGEIFFSAGTFIGRDSHNKPTSDPNAYALRLLIPQQTPISSTPPAPVLQSYSRPAEFEKGTVTYSSSLPWFTVQDPNLTPVEQLVQSPLYRLERVDRYKLIGFGWNSMSSTPQYFDFHFNEGTTGSESKTFSKTTSIEIGGSWKLSGAFTFSAKLNKRFTHSNTSIRGWSKAETRTVKTVVPSGKAVAVYSIQSLYKLLRTDESQVSAPVSYDTAHTLYWCEYPPEATPQVKVKLD